MVFSDKVNMSWILSDPNSFSAVKPMAPIWSKHFPQDGMLDGFVGMTVRGMFEVASGVNIERYKSNPYRRPQIACKMGMVLTSNPC